MSLTKRDLLWVIVLIVVAGFASGLAGGNAPSPRPQRDGFFARALRWLPWVAPAILDDGPDEEQSPEGATPRDVELYQSLPDFVINAPPDRKSAPDGTPLLDHSYGW